jgi:hypothetical protein
MRKHFSLLLAAGVLSAALISCNVTGKKSSTENKTVVTKSEAPDHLQLEFTGTDNFSIKNPKLKVSLYGIAKGLMDAKATLITSKEFEQKSVPFTVDLPIPKNPESLINPAANGSAKYYIAVEWDSDGDGKANQKGDIFIDHDKKFPNVELNNETQKIYLKILK